jgi:hypothetical protein
MTSDTYTLSTARVLESLRVAVHRDHRRRRRRRRALTVAFAVFTIAGAAVAATQEWWVDAPPATDQPVVDFQLAPTRFPDGHTELLADPKLARTVARTAGATLIAAPSAKGDGAYCMLPQLPRLPGESAGAAALGFGCVGRAAGPKGHGSTFATFTAERAGEQVWFVYGRITDDAAASIDLGEAAGRPLRVELGRAGFFIAPLPREAWARLDDRWDEVAVVAGDGRVLRRPCVPFSPPTRGSSRTAVAESQTPKGTSRAPTRDRPCRRRPSRYCRTRRRRSADIASERPVALEDFAGSPVVVEFWRSLCTNEAAARHGCQDTTLSELQALKRAQAEVAVVSLAVRDSLSAAERASLPGSYPHLRDAGGVLAGTYGVTKFPTLLFLDARHRVRARIVGVPTEAELMRALRIATGAG